MAKNLQNCFRLLLNNSQITNPRKQAVYEGTLCMNKYI